MSNAFAVASLVYRGYWHILMRSFPGIDSLMGGKNDLRDRDSSRSVRLSDLSLFRTTISPSFFTEVKKSSVSGELVLIFIRDCRVIITRFIEI